MKHYQQNSKALGVAHEQLEVEFTEASWYHNRIPDGEVEDGYEVGQTVSISGYTGATTICIHTDVVQSKRIFTATITADNSHVYLNPMVETCTDTDVVEAVKGAAAKLSTAMGDVVTRLNMYRDHLKLRIGL